MSAVYIWNLYYPSVAEVRPTIEEARRAIASLSARNYQVVGYGSHIVSIAFESPLSHEQIVRELQHVHDEKLGSLLFQANAVLVGVGQPPTLEWLQARLPRSP